jgi:hypothetical protein
MNIKPALFVAVLSVIGGVQSVKAQTVEHAPTVEQCRADQALWYSQLSHPKNILFKTLEGYRTEMGACSVVDSNDYFVKYFEVLALIDAELRDRLEHFMTRHNLVNQFAEEDAAGQR